VIRWELGTPALSGALLWHTSSVWFPAGSAGGPIALEQFVSVNVWICGKRQVPLSLNDFVPVGMLVSFTSVLQLPS